MDECIQISGKQPMCGAIFMSNRKTKLECLSRKLFGLPASQTGFVKKIKAGMLLFLFEHEERKLFGVFEATSDGALNIVPNAFRSSGMPFPAQIQFKRIWMCKPLLENKFRPAIQENYYTSQKFNFGLSYEQVYRLVHMFSEEKINVKLNQKPELFEAYEKSSSVRIPSKLRFKKTHSDVMNTGNDIESSSRSDDNCRDIGQSIHELRLGNPLIYNALPDHRVVQDSGHEPHSVALDIHPSMLQDHSDCAISHVDSSDELQPLLPSINYQSPSVSSSELSKATSSNHTVPSQASLPLISSEIHANLTDCRDMSYFNLNSPCLTSPIKPKSVRNKGSISSLKNSTIKVDGCTKTPHQKEKNGGQLVNLESSGLCISVSLEDGEIKTKESPHLLNFHRKDEFNAPFKCKMDREEENKDLKPNETMDEERIPMSIPAISKLHSDTDQRRTSAFSRLSKAQESNRQGCASHKQEEILSPSRLLEALSKKRAQWYMNTEVESMQGNQFVNKPFVGISGTEQNDVAALSSIEMFTEEKTEHPFINFKRRRIVKLKVHADDGVVVGNYKRRKLVRPSFSEENCHHVPDSIQCSAQHGTGNDVNGRPHEKKSDEIVDLSGLQIISDLHKRKCDETVDLAGLQISADSILGQVGKGISVNDTSQVSVQHGSDYNLPVDQVIGLLEHHDICEPSPGDVSSQVVAQHGADYNMQRSPYKKDCDEIIELAEHRDSCDTSLAEAVTAIPVNDSRSLNISGNGVSDAAPTWVRLKSILAQARPSGLAPPSKKLKASNSSDEVSSCEPCLSSVHTDAAGAQIFSQYDVDDTVQISQPKTKNNEAANSPNAFSQYGVDHSEQERPSKRKSDEITDSSEVSSQHDADVKPQNAPPKTDKSEQEWTPKRKNYEIADSSQAASQDADDRPHNAPPKTKSDEIPTWLRLKSIVAEAKQSVMVVKK